MAFRNLKGLDRATRRPHLLMQHQPRQLQRLQQLVTSEGTAAAAAAAAGLGQQRRRLHNSASAAASDTLSGLSGSSGSTAAAAYPSSPPSPSCSSSFFSSSSSSSSSGRAHSEPSCASPFSSSSSSRSSQVSATMAKLPSTPARLWQQQQQHKLHQAAHLEKRGFAAQAPPMPRVRARAKAKAAAEAAALETGEPTYADKLSEARSRLQVKAEQEEWNFKSRALLALPLSTAAWLALFGSYYYYSDASRVKELEGGPGWTLLIDMLGWRSLAHFGPYQMPNLVQARLHEKPLELLGEEELKDVRRAWAVNRLGMLTQRREPAQAVVKMEREAAGDTGKLPLEALFRSVFDEPEEGWGGRTAGGDALGLAAGIQDSAAKSCLDIISALPVEDRAVPPWVLSGLVCSRSPPWTEGPKGEELRASVLLQLLRTPSNCETAAKLPEVMAYVQRPGMKMKADTIFPLRAYLMSGETPDLLRLCSRLIAKAVPEAFSEPPEKKAPRDTPSLQAKSDIRAAWTSMLLTVTYAALRSWPGAFDMPALTTVVVASGCALLAEGALEVLWLGQELMIESKWYYEDSSKMLPASFLMASINAIAWAAAFQHYAMVPFFASRFVKDDFLDVYRSYAP